MVVVLVVVALLALFVVPVSGRGSHSWRVYYLYGVPVFPLPHNNWILSLLPVSILEQKSLSRRRNGRIVTPRRRKNILRKARAFLRSQPLYVHMGKEILSLGKLVRRLLADNLLRSLEHILFFAF